MRNLLLFAAITGCGRPVDDVNVRMVGVGNDPEEIGPSPTPYGGVVEYSQVDMAGGGLSLAHMGLGSYDEIGPGMTDFAPPYSAIVGFSYLFDQRLPAVDNLSFVGGTPPVNEETCYTAFSPEGPIGSFNTVDVGDFMEFISADGSRGFRMGRVPADYPADPQDLFIYYSNVEEYAPASRTHRVPTAGSNDPRAMSEEVWHKANFPFGEELLFRFPGGVTRFDQPVASIPIPSGAAGEATIPVPEALGGVMLQWQGPRFDVHGDLIGDSGPQSACFEYYSGERAVPTDAVDCDSAAELPTDEGEYNSFDGQIYTAPWDTDDGKVTLRWTPQTSGSQVVLTVRFMEELNLDDPNFMVSEVPVGDDSGDFRPAQSCEQDEAQWRFDETLLDEGGQPTAALKGDPFSRMAEVSCLLADDGEFVLDNAALDDALAYVSTRGAGGAIFFFSRETTTEVEVPAVKDPYDQRHDITPIKVNARAVRIGRFNWTAAGGGE